MRRHMPAVLRDKEIVDYLSKRAYIECTDKGYEDTVHRFVHPGDQPGDFRQAISLHIFKARAKEATSAESNPSD